VDAKRGGTGDVFKPGVLVVHNRYQQAGGEDAVVRAEIELLRRHGHRVIRYVRDNAEIELMSTWRKASLLATSTWKQQAYRELRSLIRTERPDVVHCHNLVPLISPAAYYACKAEGVPVVQSLHNFRLCCPAGTFFQNGAACHDCGGELGQAVLRGCYRKSRVQTAAVTTMLGAHRAVGTFERVVDAYSAPSEFCADQVAQGGIPKEKITVRPNFLPSDAGVRTSSDDYVLYVGRLCEEKGIRQLLRAWKRLQEIPLVIVGEGPLRAEAEQSAPASVTFVGALSPVETLARMKSARLLVFPSIGYETFGMVALESAACGVATVGSRLGAIPELIEDGRTGLLFDPHNRDEFVEKIDWAWAHPVAINEMGVAARRGYLRHYTAEQGYESLMRLYASVSKTDTNNHSCAA
jgi:glycosyltransferase involved in cell wall biosynthesis